jgi:hypothetical protein
MVPYDRKNAPHTHYVSPCGLERDPWLYDNGCCLCDAIESIRAYLTDDVPRIPWMTPEQVLASDIHYIRARGGRTE